MGFFSKEKCENCGEKKNRLLNFGIIRVEHSEILKPEDLFERRGQRFYLTYESYLEPHYALKMGDFYLYWTEQIKVTKDSFDSPAMTRLCSTECAIDYAKSQNSMLLLRFESGGAANEPPITPHQAEINAFAKSHGVNDSFREITG